MERDMSDAFQDRENTFEKQFVNDETLRFKATARRNKALAFWIADLKGVSEEAFQVNVLISLPVR